MDKQTIDRRVVQTLQWSVAVQFAFLIISSFSLRLADHGTGHLWNQIQPGSVIMVGLMGVILILLSIKSFQESLDKNTFMVILYALALITIFSQYVFQPPDINRFPKIFDNWISFRWDAIFFLIIPLVFIAWQYSFKEVVIYCLVIFMVEAIPLFRKLEREYMIFSVIRFFSNMARSIFFLMVGWIENQLVTVQRDQQDQLRKANQQLRKYALATEKLAQTQERNRLARELHDTLAHTLSSVSVQLEATKALFDRDPKAARKLVDETLRNTKNGLTETRRALIDLRASELESYGLTKAVEMAAEAAQARAGIPINCHLEKRADLASEEITHAIYRSCQEAIENILRHSDASKASISMYIKDGVMHVVIEDDGQGFDTKKIDDTKLGLRGIRERVEVLGGNVIINSSPDAGTKIHITLEGSDD